MNKHINFEDNIFILNIRVRMIQDLLILDTDSDLFLEKTLDDLNFIDSSLNTILGNLGENIRLIERDEHLYNLADLERQLRELLVELSQGEGNISGVQFPGILEKTAVLRGHSRERQKTIEDLILESKKMSIDPVVGLDEMHELLSN